MLMMSLFHFNYELQSPFGDPVEPEKAPEAISKAVASLPPEQMFELMKQMKVSRLQSWPHTRLIDFTLSRNNSLS